MNAGLCVIVKEMYERTPLSRGVSLDPNPLGQGEFIEHKHSLITCNSGLRSFPMLKVGLLHYSRQHRLTLSIVAFRVFSRIILFKRTKLGPLKVKTEKGVSSFCLCQFI